MAVAVIMPRQGQSVETCILGQWYKSEGDPVKAGDILFSYETDKAAFDEEAKVDGTLLKQFFSEGDEVPVLATIGIVGQPGENWPETADASRVGTDEPETLSTMPSGGTEQVQEPASGGARIRISPLARKMAAGMNLDYTLIQGTGPQGRIIARDIEQAGSVAAMPPKAAVLEVPVVPAAAANAGIAPEKPAIAPDGAGYQLKPLSNVRKLIARAMHQSLQNSAQLTHHLSADARALLAARKRYKSEFEKGQTDANVTVNDLVCFAVIKALKQFPQVNSHLLGDQMKIFGKVHLGLAVDTERGLMVPALRDADDYSVTGLSNQLGQLAANSRSGSINPDLLSPEAASFTVSNLGNYGVEFFTPVINLPQTAILGVCSIVPRPKDLGDGVFAFVPVIGLSLTYDHRALDGGEATRFLSQVAREIENL